MSTVRELVTAQLMGLDIDPTTPEVMDELELLDRGVIAGQSSRTPTKQLAVYYAIGRMLLDGEITLVGIRNRKLEFKSTEKFDSAADQPVRYLTPFALDSAPGQPSSARARQRRRRSAMLKLQRASGTSTRRGFAGDLAGRSQWVSSSRRTGRCSVLPLSGGRSRALRRGVLAGLRSTWERTRLAELSTGPAWLMPRTP